MPDESQIPIASQAGSKRFARRLSLFYGASFGLIGTHLPFFPVWLKAVGIDASWIGIITAVPAVTRFTILPFVTTLAEKHQTLRGAHDGHGLSDRARICHRRHPARAARGIPGLRRHRLRMDADGAA